MKATLGLVVLGLLAALGVWTTQPLSRRSTFDVASAMEILRDVARAPHPPGSAEHERVRQVAEDHLRRAGFQVEEQAATTSQVYSRGLPTRVTNQVSIVAVRKGSAPDEPAVLLAAHYDSVATGPGAADDGYGLASVLEIARVLPATTRTVILLLTDGEEIGLVGAKAFVARHPLARKVGVVLNIEARGNSGPAILFETVGPNRALVDAAANAPDLQGNSLAQSIYEKMPNSTDLTAFRELGIPGLNIANVGGLSAYHAPGDTVAHASPGTLWQAGSTALAAVQALASTPPATALVPDRGNAIFFDVAGLVFVSYPASWSWLVTLLALGLLVTCAVLAARRRKLRVPGVGLVLGLQLGALVAAAVLGVGVLLLARAINPELLSPAARPLSVELFVVAHAFLGLGLAAVATRLWGQRFSAEERLVAGGVLWLILTVLLHRHLAGGAYLFAVPLVGLMAGGLLGQLHPRLAWLGLALGAVPGVLLLTGTMVLLGQAFVAAASVGVLVLVVITLAPAAQLLAARRLWQVGLGLGLVLAGLAVMLPVHDADAPRPHALLWVWNGERAEWLSPDPGPPPAWSAARLPTRSTLGDLVPTAAETPVWRGPASAPPPGSVPQPEACLDGDDIVLSSPPGTTLLAIDVPVRLASASLNQEPVPLLPSGALAVHLFGPGRADRLRVDPAIKSLQLVAQVPGLPENVLASRPATVANKPSLVLPPHAEIANGDMSLIQRHVELHPCRTP